MGRRDQKKQTLIVLAVLAAGATALTMKGIRRDGAAIGPPEPDSLAARTRLPGVRRRIDESQKLEGNSGNRLARHYVERYEGKVVTEAGDLVTVRTVYKNCHDAKDGFACDTEDVVDHPYGAYSFDELASIADFDAAASFILGHRIFEDPAYRKQFEGDTWYQAGVNHLLNASLLSGARQPYTAMMNHRNLVGLGYIEGAAGWNRLEQVYTWSQAGIELGYLDPAWPGYHAARRFISEEMASDAKSILDDLDKKADAIKRYLIEKKARTTG